MVKVTWHHLECGFYGMSDTRSRYDARMATKIVGDATKAAEQILDTTWAEIAGDS